MCQNRRISFVLDTILARFPSINNNITMVLLRIDVYPHNATLDKRHSTTDASTSGNWELPKSPHEPLYACLASASASTSGSADGNHNGAILQVGRKDADVVFSRDKSVSRKHLQVRIVSQDSQHQSNLLLAEGKETSSSEHEEPLDAVAAAAAAPKQSDELQACRTSRDGMCVVLSDMGAKFGSYLVMDKKETSTKQSASSNDDDDDETGDETEDETANNTDKGTPLSAMTSNVVPNPSSKVLKRLAPNSSIVLDDLCETETTSANDHKQMAVIQCGQNGSTLVITRIPMKFAFSRVDSTEKKECQKQMYAIGATCTDNLEEMTHLVTKDKISAPKALTAWCRNVPLVTTQYIRQLLDRTSSRDPMPNPSDTIQEGKEPFWKLTPNPKLWSNCTLLVLSENDMVSVIRATGVTVVDKLQSHKHLSETEFEEILSSVVKEHAGCFYIETPSKRKVSRKKLSILKNRGIPCLTSKLIAKLVTSQKPLGDEDGNAIGGQQTSVAVSVTAAQQGNDTVYTTDNTNDPEESTQRLGEGTQLESQALFSNILSSAEPSQRGWTKRKPNTKDKEAAMSSQKLPSQSNTTRETEELSKTTKRPREDSSRQKKREDEMEETTAQNASDKYKQPSKRKKESDVHSELRNPSQEQLAISKRTKRNYNRDDVEQESAQDKNVLDADYVDLSDNERQLKRKKKQRVVEPDGNDAVVETNSKFKRGLDVHNLKPKRGSREETGTTRRNGKRKKLTTSNDGWLVIAPCGAERNLYRRTDMELKEKYENEHGILPGENGYNLSTTAEIDVTDVRDNLVIPKSARRQTSTGGGGRSTDRRHGGGTGNRLKDFKKFRKNDVEVTSFRTSRIKLFSVLPKESEREKEIFEQERQLEEEKKIAESLFRDPNGGMRSFFGKSKNQVGRKRRTRV